MFEVQSGKEDSGPSFFLCLTSHIQTFTALHPSSFISQRAEICVPSISCCIYHSALYVVMVTRGKHLEKEAMSSFPPYCSASYISFSLLHTIVHMASCWLSYARELSYTLTGVIFKSHSQNVVLGPIAVASPGSLLQIRSQCLLHT